MRRFVVGKTRVITTGNTPLTATAKKRKPPLTTGMLDENRKLKREVPNDNSAK